MLISVIIPAYNEEKILGQTLERIHYAFDANRDTGVVWELIVCDNHSTDQTADIASQMGARVVAEPIQQISRARNRGAAIAEGEWLIFIDADSYPPPALIAEVLDVIGAGNCIGCGTTVDVQGGSLFNKLRMERLNPFFRLFRWSGGAFLACQGETFHALGGFSTDLYAYEEVDFVLRLKRHGRKLGKEFSVLHRHPVITSGRKGEPQLLSLGELFVSNFIAVLLFGLYYVLPGWIIAKLGSRLLGYWYRRRRGLRGDEVV